MPYPKMIKARNLNGEVTKVAFLSISVSINGISLEKQVSVKNKNFSTTYHKDKKQGKHLKRFETKCAKQGSSRGKK